MFFFFLLASFGSTYRRHSWGYLSHSTSLFSKLSLSVRENSLSWPSVVTQSPLLIWTIVESSSLLLIIIRLFRCRLRRSGFISCFSSLLSAIANCFSLFGTFSPSRPKFPQISFLFLFVFSFSIKFDVANLLFPTMCSRFSLSFTGYGLCRATHRSFRNLR